MAPMYVLFIAALCLRQASAQTLGGACSATAPQCTDTNAECVSNVCNCKSGFTASGTTCVQNTQVALGASCAAAGATCSAANAECNAAKTCACKTGFTASGTNCVQNTQVALGASCAAAGATCSDANAECNAAKTCACKTGYTASGTTCVQNTQVALGASCAAAGASCSDANAECNAAKTCACKSGYTASGTTCTQNTQVAVGASCAATGATCSDSNAECSSTTKVCTCKTGYTQSGTSCVMNNRVQILNGACSSDSECACPWSYCLNRKCTCRPKYKKENDFSCSPIQYFCPVSSWFNDPIKVGGQPLSCIAYTITPTAATSTSCAKTRLDNCPIGTYCNVIQASDALPTGTTKTGVCCATPKVMCPTGDSLATYANGDCSGCPTSTHFCFCDALTNMAACCPRSCPSGQQYSNGFCAYSGSSGSSSTPTVTIPSTCNTNNDCFSGATCVVIPNQTTKQCVCSGGLNYINGQCTSNLCANGNPAMTNGAITTCSASQPCATNYQCDTTRGICCPTSSSSSGSTTTCTNGNAPISGATCTTAGATCGTAPTTGTCQQPSGSTSMICCA